MKPTGCPTEMSSNRVCLLNDGRTCKVELPVPKSVNFQYNNPSTKVVATQKPLVHC